GVVRIVHHGPNPLRIASLSIALKGATSCSYFSQSKGAVRYREKVLVSLHQSLLSTEETVPAYAGRIDIPFQLALPEPPDRLDHFRDAANRDADLAPEGNGGNTVDAASVGNDGDVPTGVLIGFDGERGRVDFGGSASVPVDEVSATVENGNGVGGAGSAGNLARVDQAAGSGSGGGGRSRGRNSHRNRSSIVDSELLRYAIRIANLLPPSTQMRGVSTSHSTGGTPFQARTAYVLTAEMRRSASTATVSAPLALARSYFWPDPPLTAAALVEPFVVHDPRTLPLLMHPEPRRWRSAPGDHPVEYDVEVSATTLGPGDAFRFAYRLAVARDAAAAGIRIRSVTLALREHRAVGSASRGGRSLRSSVDLARWVFDELDGDANESQLPHHPPARVDLADLRPQRKMRQLAASANYVSRHPSAAAADEYDLPDNPEVEPDTEPADINGRRRHNGLYADRDARLAVPLRFQPHPFPTPSFHDDPADPAHLPPPSLPTAGDLSVATLLASPSTVFTPSSPRPPPDPALLYPSLQPPGLSPASVDVRHSFAIRISFARAAQPPPPPHLAHPLHPPALHAPGAGRASAAPSLVPPAAPAAPSPAAASPDPAAAAAPPRPVVLECWCALGSVARADVDALLDQRPELVPPLDYDRICGGPATAAAGWLPKYERTDSAWDAGPPPSGEDESPSQLDPPQLDLPRPPSSSSSSSSSLASPSPSPFLSAATEGMSEDVDVPAPTRLPPFAPPSPPLQPPPPLTTTVSPVAGDVGFAGRVAGTHALLPPSPPPRDAGASGESAGLSWHPVVGGGGDSVGGEADTAAALEEVAGVRAE
ncbi:hypothetical protein HK405_010605, partial [Cladochytrium tenue]